MWKEQKQMIESGSIDIIVNSKVSHVLRMSTIIMKRMLISVWTD